jgi:DNA-binding transcriptional LysR family regulator
MMIQRSGSYTEAAVMLGLSQPAISSHMKRLQQMVGGELFERGPGGLQLSARGETVKHYASRILNLNWQMLRTCGAGELKHTLRIGIQNVFSATHLVSLQQSLDNRLKQHRSVTTWALGDDLCENVRAGYLDAAFVVRASAGAIQAMHRWDEKMCWICSKNFVLTEARPIPLLSWPNSVSDALAVEALTQAGAPYSVVLVANDLMTHFAALRAGFGLLILPQRLVPPDLKVAEFHYLPTLPVTTSGVYLNEGIPRAEAELLTGAIGDVMPPNAHLGPEALSAPRQVAMI